ncbi:MAG: FTR1 family protein [Anaerolineaceae bacterium]|nr:FTR1 family protein [Anaerolineaceae bacterium]
MFPSFILALREGIEAALIIGIVFGTLRKTNLRELDSQVWSGTITGVIASFLAAWLLNILGASFEGAAEEIFEGLAMIFAAGVLTWMIFWMNRQARSIRTHLEENVQQAAINQGKMPIFALTFIAVFREGIELSLFLTAVSFSSGEQGILVGAMLGISTAVLITWLLNKSLIKLDMKRFFFTSSALLLIFAAGLLAYGIHELNEVGWIPPIIEHVWDINYILDENSNLGEMLKALIGYNGNPSLTEVISYFVYSGIIAFSLLRKRVKEPLADIPAQD